MSAPPACQVMRLARRIAHTSFASRRQAEDMIRAGRVRVNGRVAASPALNVGPGDRIELDSRPLPAIPPPRLWRYHKPRGLLTARRDPQQRPVIFDHLPPLLRAAAPVGRLDMSSEGLLLLTNNGALARALELPASNFLRRYRVRAFGEVSQQDLDRLAQGLTLKGVRYAPAQAKLERRQARNCWIAIGLREGKNREVRLLLEAQGLIVNRLIRTHFGPFALGALAPGRWREVPPAQLQKLTLPGPARAACAGAR